ncbi:MAG: hypothetical protein Q8K91_04385 [Hylemonella sp.]|nr:hypothetical protein [Hylemonella sp.]MDP1936429.1 hypothetical protein [Hylemonella sp.]
MQLKTIETVSVVHQIKCDRCGSMAERGGFDFHRMTSIGFNAGYDSIFGDGNRVDLDLCEPCLRDTLGTWLRVTHAQTSLDAQLASFRPEVHGGEFPSNE